MPISNVTRNKRARRLVAWLICATLGLAVLLLAASEYHYLQKNASPLSHPAPPPPGWPEDERLAAMELQPLSQPVLWSDANLADKINGKAELYLAAGFVNMHSARYALMSAPELFFEVQLFRQNSPDNAFAVFSQQRRAHGLALDWAEHGYSTSNALYLQQGPYYLEMTGVNQDDRLFGAMSAWGGQWLSRQTSKNINPGDMFAPQHLLPDSIMLLAKDAFGLAGLDNVWVAQYSLHGADYLLFVKPVAHRDEAARLMRQLHDFWNMQGAVPLESEGFELEGMYELLAIQDHYLLGAHEASNLDDARLLLENLSHYLAER